jgi:FkbM family methyltransferase
VKRKAAHVLFQIARYRRGLPVRLLARASEGFLRLYNNVNYDAEANGERRILELLGRRNIACVFDVGANIGEWLQLARRHCPSATIHAFEIVPFTFEKLRRHIGTEPGLILNPFGLAERRGTVEVLYCPDDPELSSIFPYPTGKQSLPVSCNITTGDEYCAERGIAHVDFLKLDVEGLELPALRGFEGMLANGQIDVIQFEYGFINILPKFLLKDLYEFLGAHGYAAGKIFPGYVDFRAYELKDEDFMGPNYLAVRRDCRDLIALLS